MPTTCAKSKRSFALRNFAESENRAKCILTKRELSAALPMTERTIEKLVSTGVLPALKITPMMVRFELSAVLAALRKYETATLK